MATDRLREQLKRQLGFIERSCEAYDNGFTDEAVRIATTIRVLIHDTKASTSLLTLLNAKSIKVLSTCRPHAVSPNTIAFEGLTSLQLSGSGLTFGPKLGMSSFQQEIPLEDWWKQVVLVAACVPFSRGQITLASANKDGGTHVDPKLTTAFQSLLDGVVMIGDETSSEQFTNHHFPIVRQMGYELLKSRELLALA